MKYADYELMRIPNMGRKTVNELKDILAGLGLHLRDQDAPGSPTHKPTRWRNILTERELIAHQMRSLGLTYREIGLTLGGISIERTRQIVAKAQRKLESRPMHFVHTAA